MEIFPTLRTDRLLLRQFQLSDAIDVQRLAGVKEVAAGTFLPHPYPDGLAEQWITSQQQDFEAGTLVNFALVLQADEVLIGSIELDMVVGHQHARMSYWLGVPYWNQGYGTEAVNAVLAYGFTQRHLHRIYAPHFLNNPASGRVLQKVGMTYEGSMREHYVRFGQYVDVELYGMLEQDFPRR
jgi:RimJ/RimL family protein N-acetyltransferase